MSADIIARVEAHFPELAARMHTLPKALAPAWLKGAAAQNTGLSDFGPAIYEEPLEKLCRSANEDANLNPLGRMILAQTIITQLENRALMQRLRAQNAPELRTELIPPIIVTGLPRTGTTALHRLLASDPAHAAIPYWQLNRPIARTPEDTIEKRRAEVEQTVALRAALTPELDKIHLIRADIPEECMFVTASSMQSRLYWNLAPVYGFMKWYNTADRTDKYCEYTEWLRLFQASYPGKRLVLKAPDHVDGLDALMTTLPDAIIVQTHRDMVEQFGSYLSLARATKELAVNELDKARDLEAVLALTDTSIARNFAAREANPNRIIDIRYTDLIEDPLGTVASIYNQAGLSVSRSAQDALNAHQRGNQKGKRGQHIYDLDEYGMTTVFVQERYAEYMSAFRTG